MKSTLSTLLISTALAVPFAAHAQQTSVEEACANLQAALASELPEGADEAQITQIVETGDGEACRVEYERLFVAQSQSGETQSESGATVAETEAVTLSLEDEVTIQGRVLLDQSPPRVEVEQSPADVEIEPGAPTITVSEGQGEIVVRQAPANVTIDMPTPTIRIEQAAPEIIITMPDPDVSVGAAQPTVRVEQAEPRISISQAPPQVDLELERVEDGAEGGFEVTDNRSGQAYQSGTAPEAVTTEDAEVTVTRGEPVVTMAEATEEANVTIERSEPTVRFEQADPQVDVTTSGEPQVEFVQSGEPTVTFQEAGAGSEASATDQASAEPTEGDAAQPLMAEEPTETEPAPETVAQSESTEPEAPASDVTADPALAETDTAETEMPVAEGDTVETTTPVELGGPTVEREGYTLAQAGEFEVESLTGSNLYGVNDEDIGEIGDLILSSDGQIEGVLVEMGGFLGLGQREVQVPYDRLSILTSETGDIRAYIDATQEELEAMPEAQ
ncbi:PRC-barrel domain-containing protein [uncultured Jannaschia sp.]|uniref:PRC-barrel domain-containing protein n=2 Tax=uncultured Jannaschia sp. TaxID=293347 RepID=UPI00261513F1|nr:PRC-barrel domain-containing protein [uncultured Jannaschia sp.]